MSSCDNPKFYKSDMVALIRERNELKERVLELEEELRVLKENSCTCIQRSPCASKSNGQVTSCTEGPTPASILNKPLRASILTESYITDMLVSGYTKRERKYVYIIKVTWSDGQRFEVHRSYGQLFTLRNSLIQQFPEHTKLKSASNSIPPLASNTWDLLRINTATLTRARLGTINTFCQVLVLQTIIDISMSSEVIHFFKPAIWDKQLPRLKKRSDMDLSILSIYPQSTPAGSSFELYTVLADYVGETDNELTAKAGDVVAVIHKLDSGWWFVSKNGPGKEQLGFISRDFLKLKEEKEVQLRVSNGISHGIMDATRVDSEMKYVAVEDYCTTDPRQLSFSQGDMMIVLEKSDDGWWLAILIVKQGWVPSSYLIPHETPAEQQKDIPSSGVEHIASSGYRGLLKEDISFPKGAVVEVLDKDNNGWCVVRYLGKVGIAPFSCLIPSRFARNEDNSKMEQTQSFSDLAGPPPRSKQFMRSTERRIRHKLSANHSSQNSASPAIPFKSLHKN